MKSHNPLQSRFDALLEASRWVLHAISGVSRGGGPTQSGETEAALDSLKAAIAAAEGGREEPESQPDYSKGVPRSVVLERQKKAEPGQDWAELRPLSGGGFVLVDSNKAKEPIVWFVSCTHCDEMYYTSLMGERCKQDDCPGVFVPIIDDPEPKFYTLSNGSKIEIGDVDEADRIMSTQYDACWFADDPSMRVRSFLHWFAKRHKGADVIASIHDPVNEDLAELRVSDILALLEPDTEA